MNSKNKEFLKIDDIIKKAKDRGVDFGNAKPRSRLRYYAKLGLIPPAERKVFDDGNQPTGAYPKYVLEILEKIDEKIKNGKSIREIAEEKKEKEKKELEKDIKKKKSGKEKSEIPSPSSIIPKHIADLLEKIDEKLGKGKDVNLTEEDKKEFQKTEVAYDSPAITLIPTYRKKNTQGQNDQAEEAAVQKAHFKKEEKSHSFLFSLVRFVTPILLIGVFGFIIGMGFFGENIFGFGFFDQDLSANLLSSLSTSTRLKSNQAPRSSLTTDLLAQAGGEEALTTQGVSDSLKTEPYFNINVETDINAPLNLRGDGTTSPALSFFQNGFEGTLTTSGLTDDQSYSLPNQSGTICLSSGNCESMQGQITTTGGIDGKLAKFTDPNNITSASISDLYEGEPILNITEEGSVFLSPPEGEDSAVLEFDDSLRFETNDNLSFYINSEGNVGLGKENPETQFDVDGRIQASGDICTDAGGGQCLSEVSSGFSFIPSGGGGIDGSGSSGYLARWTGAEEVGDSILYQTSNRIGIGNTSPTSTLHITGTTTMDGFQMPTNATSGYILTADSSGVGTWQPANTSASLPSASTSQTLYYDGLNWISNSLLTNTGSRIGIGTSSPESKLTIAGTTTSAGNFFLNFNESSLSANSFLNSPEFVFRGYYDATSSTSTIESTSTKIILKNITHADGDYRLGIFDSSNSEFISIDGTNRRMGIGNLNPGTALDVSGTVKMSGFEMPSNATSGYVLTTDSSGVGTWKPSATGTLPSGSNGETLRYDGSNWLTNSLLTNTGSRIGIGTDSPTEKLSIAGNTLIGGKLTISTTTVSQLALENGSNLLNFLISTSSSEIQATNDLTINSLNGEIKVGDGNVVLASATGSPTVRASGEYVLRGSIPIFKYSWAGGAQTNSTSYKKVSKTFSVADSLSSSTPEALDGATRYYSFLINYADQINSGSNSEWRVYRPSANATTSSFNLSGQGMGGLDEGNPIMSDYLSSSEIPDNDWQLEVRAPTSDDIRIFNVFLLIYDKIN